MTLNELKKDMRRHTGGCGVITLSQLADYLGYCHKGDVKKNFCKGLEAFNGTRYFIPDVAERVYESRKRK